MTDINDYHSFVVAPDEEIPGELPHFIRIIDTGKRIKANIDKMTLNGDDGHKSITLRDREQLLSKATAQIYYFVMLNALNGQRKVSTVCRWNTEFWLFIRTVSTKTNKPISTITFNMFNWYTSKKNASQQKLTRSVLKFWMSQAVPGIANDLKEYLTTSKSPKPRSTIEIQNNVPRERPFTINQVRKFLSTIEELYINGSFNPQDNLLWRLMISEAMRPSQMQLLQFGDIKLTLDKDNHIKYVHLMVPIVKQAATQAREYMMKCQLSEPVAKAILEHRDFVASLLGRTPDGSLPLFSIVRSYNKELSVSKISIGIIPQIVRTRKLILVDDSKMSDWDLFTRRFKHTKLTHLAMLGAPLDVLARAGYQTSTISLSHYVNLTEEAFTEYENLLSHQYDHIVSAFKGKVLKQKQATHSDLNHRILDSKMNKSVGSCATNICNVFAPFGCYTCPRFEAFHDGPHKAVLNSLIKKKQHAVNMGLPTETVRRDDHLIIAVKEVITLIEKEKQCGS